MSLAHEKLAVILRTKPEVILGLEGKLEKLTGKTGVLEGIIEQNDMLIEQTLSELDIGSQNRDAGTVYQALINRLKRFDEHLSNYLGKPDLSQMSIICGRLCETALTLNQPPKGFFIKKERAVQMLEKFPPQNLLDFFGYQGVADLVAKEGFSSVFSALRFAQDQKWMHEFFEKAYDGLSASDFEERVVELKVLESKWLDVADKFLEKKYHNVSHLKELGIIFVIPLKIDTPGETLRLFTLVLHYLNEVPFYSKLFRKFSTEPNFSDKLKSLLRGDVLLTQLPTSNHQPLTNHQSLTPIANYQSPINHQPLTPTSNHQPLTIRIVQRYLAKDDPNDFRLFEPHVNPEAEHWYKAINDLGKIALPSEIWTKEGQSLDFAGDFFSSSSAGVQLVSFDLVDLVMSLVKKDQVKYLYHQQEALWNKIFIEYLGRDRVDDLIEENIISGFIKLE